jgi:hypothetical protein
MSINWAFDDDCGTIVNTRVQHFIDEVRSKEYDLSRDEVKDLADLLEVYVVNGDEENID